MTPEINALAAQVAQNGFKWVEDGANIKKICELLKPLKPADKQMRVYLVDSLKALDRTFNWQMAGKTQAQEDALYGMFVDLLLQ